MAVRYQHVQAHLSAAVRQRHRHEVGGPHPVLQRTEHVLHSASSQGHGVKFPVQPPLDALQNLFVFPPADAPVVAGRALIFHGATRESTGLVEACVKTVPLDRVEPIDGAFACWALVLVIPGDVDEVASCRSAPRPWRATSLAWARRSR